MTGNFETAIINVQLQDFSQGQQLKLDMNGYLFPNNVNFMEKAADRAARELLETGTFNRFISCNEDK